MRFPHISCIFGWFVSGCKQLLLGKGTEGPNFVDNSLRAAACFLTIHSKTGNKTFRCDKEAIIEGNLELTRDLLQSSADVNCCDDAWVTPLQEACRQGDLEMVELLASRLEI